MTDDRDEPSDHDLWPRIARELRQAVSTEMYDMWLAPLELAEIDGDVVVVRAPAELRGWVADRFGRVLQTAAAAVLGPETTVDVRAGAVRRAGPAGSRRRAEAGREADVRDSALPEADTLNPRFTFHQFVIGESNRFAHAAGLAVAELPGQAYNPLFVTGPPGVGKTHLLHAIGHYVREHDPTLAVRYTTVETFTNDFVAALGGGGSIERFKARFRHNDVLLVDDIQELASKARTEEEFLHTFDALHQAGSQIVVTADRLPGELTALDERLRERLGSSLVTTIAPADVQTRLVVLRKRVQLDGVDVHGDEVLELLVDRVPANPRALEGALVRIVAFASLTGRAVDVALTRRVLDDLYPVGTHRPGEGPRPSIERIQELTAEAFGLTTDELVSSARSPRIAWPRQVAMFLARAHTGSTLPAIGRGFGGRNHTTVLHACRRTVARLATDPEAREVVDELTRRLSESGRRD